MTTDYKLTVPAKLDEAYHIEAADDRVAFDLRFRVRGIKGSDPRTYEVDVQIPGDDKRPWYKNAARLWQIASNKWGGTVIPEHCETLKSAKYHTFEKLARGIAEQRDVYERVLHGGKEPPTATRDAGSRAATAGPDESRGRFVRGPLFADLIDYFEKIPADVVSTVEVALTMVCGEETKLPEELRERILKGYDQQARYLINTLGACPANHD